MFVCCECCVLSGRGLCDELITRPEESYRLWCVVVCDLETSRTRRPWPALGSNATEKKNNNSNTRYTTYTTLRDWFKRWNSLGRLAVSSVIIWKLRIINNYLLDVTACKAVQFYRRFGGTHVPSILSPWRWRRHIPELRTLQPQQKTQNLACAVTCITVHQILRLR